MTGDPHLAKAAFVAVDLAAASSIVASLFGYLPTVGAALGIVWYCIVIWREWPTLVAEWRRRYGRKP